MHIISSVTQIITKSFLTFIFLTTLNAQADTVQEISSWLSYYENSKLSGMVITNIPTTSPCQKVGFIKGDIVKTIADKDIQSFLKETRLENDLENQELLNKTLEELCADRFRGKIVVERFDPPKISKSLVFINPSENIITPTDTQK